MLLNIHIKNLALIDELDVDFNNGLNILTGETGAGKSIIIGSLGIGFGGKFDRNLLRDEDREGLVELIFSADDEHIRNELEKLDVTPDEDGYIMISRKLNQAGRVVNRINDNTVTLAKVKDVAGVLIDLHAQHEQQSLLIKNKHLEILDRYGKEEIADKKAEVKKLYETYVNLYDKLDSMNMSEDERLRKKDYITYRINEISSAHLVEGEDENLEIYYKKAINSKDILEGLDKIHSITGYDGTASFGNSISYVLSDMKGLAELDSDLDGTYKILSDIDGMLNDFNRELSDYMKSMEFDEGQFKETEDRLNLINTLKSKYGNTIEDVLNSRDELEIELKELSDYENRLESIKKELKETEELLKQKCDELTDIRRKNAKELCELIKQSLTELNFMSVAFEMSFNKLDRYSASGNDEAYFMISTNVGEPTKPLYEVASGGELSRVMLAIKSCLASEDDIPTLIFDEIDVGISGKTAQKVAEKMSVIAREHQVICITHLPQIAAMADTHYVIEKVVENNKTITKIKKLKKEQQIEELARILGGADITEANLTSAAEMKGLAD
ncbi:MAG: DNA repair protein RecN, partial [Lachnospiraceae bacterium]|nr:DNA repair protein RecN [Lachnospiraceae bacterium]